MSPLPNPPAPHLNPPAPTTYPDAVVAGARAMWDAWKYCDPALVPDSWNAWCSAFAGGLEAMLPDIVNRFLLWPLPADFAPDDGISAQRPNYHPDVQWQPLGTNLLTATQAAAMLRFVLSLPQPPRTTGDAA